jgi:putative ABC transport system ATP-binding protein
VRVLGHELGALTGSARDRFRADHIGVIFQLFNLISVSVGARKRVPAVRLLAPAPHRCEQSGTSVRDVATRLLDHLDMGDRELQAAR